ncbi:general stress protein [Streptomyces sp. NPDC048434]|uniref:general stress protein n=1 Tax=Streptomyces sp. NPDC048434 TaxID=3365549 RepID=UPI0037155C14
MSAQGRQTIASYSPCAEAERAVDYLSDQEFPGERVAIVGHGLHLVGQVVGRVGFGRAALSGAAPGALIDWIFGIRQARLQAANVGHPIVQPLEPGENWRWCYVHEAVV